MNLKTNCKLGQPSNLVSVLYDSLVVEYRLLMSMIFLEHSFDIEFEAPNMNYQGFHNEQRPEHEHFGLHRGMAYIIGVAFFLFQGVNIIQYTSQVGWPNFVAYLTDILLIVLGLIIFVKIKRLLPEDFEEDCSAVDLLLVMMGMFSILYWLFRCCVVGTWAISFTNHHLKNYALWNTVKYGLRIFSTAFLVFIFTNIPRNIPDNNRVVQSSELHFLMPLYLFVLLASYASSIIATYNGQIESWILALYPDLSIGFQILYQAGGPIHLGFSLHVVVHFAYICKALSDEYTRVATEIEVDADDAGD
uniref:Frizzled/Smoothened 7TM domain-containing protein n=1 Tax=Clytia hemisphaerica TaxID=252671 RepID=A0A7M5V9G5_9CNID